jgi:antitoxin component of MazEF toxin-antitoxin module
MTLQFKTNIDKKGNVHLPDEILKALHLNVEDSITIATEDGKITLQPFCEDPKVIEKDGLLVIHPQITGDLADVVRQNREAGLSQ